MKIEIEITEQEFKDLKAIRNYFGEHDKTMFEHKAYAVLDRLVKLLATPAVSNSAFKCVEPELQPVECEKWRGCFDCPYYRQS